MSRGNYFIHSDPPVEIPERFQIYREDYACFDTGTAKHAVYSKAFIELQYRKVEQAFKDLLNYDLNIEIDYVWFSDGFTAQAWEDKKIVFCIENMRYSDMLYIILHEIAHCLDHRHFVSLGNEGHSLEFAVFNALLRRAISGYTKNFYVQYDLHEDSMYKNMLINCSDYDKKIMSANVDTFQDILNSVADITSKIADASYKKTKPVDKYADRINFEIEGAKDAREFLIETTKKNCYEVEKKLFEGFGYEANMSLRTTNSTHEYSLCIDLEDRIYLLNLNGHLNKDFSDLVIHKLAHQIVYDFDIHENMKRFSSIHSLEFAFIYYCLLNKLTGKYRAFFNAEDVIDDHAVYNNLSINMNKFDNLVLSIQFDNIEKLVQQAIFMANYVRNKFCS